MTPSPAITLVTGPPDRQDRYLYAREAADYDDPLDNPDNDGE